MSSGEWPQTEQELAPLPRRRGMLSLVFVGVVAAGLLVGWALQPAGEATVARVGSPAPTFVVPMLDGTEFDLADHIADDGRPVVLNLWASWCAPCRAEIPEISAWAAANPQAYVIGIAVEDQEAAARELAAELAPGYDLAIGDPEFRSAYPTIGLPATFFIDRDGNVAELINGVVTEESLDAAVGPIAR